MLAHKAHYVLHVPWMAAAAAKAGIAFIRMDSEIQTLVRRAEEV
jgi:hypothetical protein